MMKDYRIPFDEAVAAFREFAVKEGKSTNFLWVCQDRVCIRFGRVWIYRPDELQGDESAKVFYETACKGDSSLSLLGICSLGERYVTCIERMPSPPHDGYRLYMSLMKWPGYSMFPVRSRIFWSVLRHLPSVSKVNSVLWERLSLHRTMK